MADISRLLRLSSGVVTGIDLTSNELLVNKIAVKDGSGNFFLYVTDSETLTANRTLTVTVGDADRTLALTGNVSLNQNLLTTSSPTFGGLTLNGNIDTTGANIVWNLKDNSATALSIDTSGKTGLIAIDTTDGAEVVTMSGNLVVAGDFTVNGTTTTINTTNTNITDKLITLNKGGGAASGGGSGIEVEENSSITGYWKVSSSRNGWDLKAPNNAAVATFNPTATKTITIGGALNISGDSVINQDVSTSAAPTFTGLTLSGTPAQITLTDNTASALQIGSTGALDIIKIVTTDGSEKAILFDGSEMKSAAAPTTNAGIANKKYVDDSVSASTPGALQKTVTLGETIGVSAQVHITPVRWALTGETAGRVYKANKDAVGNSYAIGFITTTGAQIAGSTAVLIMVGEQTLGADDTAFASGDVGKPVYISGSGAFSTTAPTTAGDVVYRLGIVKTTTIVDVNTQLNGVN